MDVMLAHVSAPVPELPDRAALPPALCELVARMLSKLPEERPPSIAEVRVTLERLAAAPSTSAAFPALAPASPPPAVPPRRGAWWWGALAALAVLAGAVELVLWKSAGPRPSTSLSPGEPGPAATAVPDGGEAGDPDAGEADAGLADGGATDAGAPDAGADPLRAPALAPPGARALLVRIDRLEQLSRTRSNFDPSAMPFLQSMRRRLRADESVLMRKKVAGELDRWERQYLR